MRLITVLLLTVALAAAGCFGKSNNPTPTPTSSGGGSTTPTTGGGGTTTTPTSTGTTPTTSPTSGGSGNNSSTTTKVAPKQLCTVSFDFTKASPPTPPATAGPPQTADCGTVTTGYTKVSMDGNFTTSSGAPVALQNSVDVILLDSTGTAVLTCAGPSPGPTTTSPCSQQGAIKAGTYTLKADGLGDLTFAGTVMIS